MKYEIWQRKLDKVWFLPLNKEDIVFDDYQKTYEGEIEISSHHVALEELFAKFNRDDRPTAQTSYSLSMNDIAKLDGNYYVCCMLGWEKISV